MGPLPRSFKKWLLIVCGVLFVVLAAGAGWLSYRARHREEQLRQQIVQTLSERFLSNVELKSLHVRFFPRIAGDGEDLVIRHHGRTDVPPLIRIRRFSFAVSILGLLHSRKHIPLVELEDMVITIPPRERANGNEAQAKVQPPSNENPLPRITVDKIVCNDADIVILPKAANKVPLDWDIHNLVLYSVSTKKPLTFHGELTNGKPKGEIDTYGEFGPWDANDPGNTPVSGRYTFTNADLNPLPGIGGTLSSVGKYSGVLAELQVEGTTDTPNFSLDKVGKPVPLHTDFYATVDGTNGDTLLHPVNAVLGQTLIVTDGSVVDIPDKGHLITMNASVPNGRIQDVLSLAINSPKPAMTGPIKLKAKVVVTPGKEDAFEKLILDGQFGVDDAKWNNPELRDRLKALSARALGKPEEEDIGSALTDLKGNFHLEKGLITFRDLTFAVEGAKIDLAGTYSIREGQFDMKGRLQLEAKLSQTITGAKSFFLKALDPFFSKNGAGTDLPITITGTREKPVFSVSVFHKTIKKDLASQTPPGDKKD